MSQLMIKLETWLLLHDFYGLQIICFAFDEQVNLRLGLMTFFMIQVSNFVQVIQFVKHVICILWLLCYNAILHDESANEFESVVWSAWLS